MPCLKQRLLIYAALATAIIVAGAAAMNVPRVWNYYGFHQLTLHNYLTGADRIWSDHDGRFIPVTRLDRTVRYPPVAIGPLDTGYTTSLGIGHITLTSRSDAVRQVEVAITGYDADGKELFREEELLEVQAQQPCTVTCNGIAVKTVACRVIAAYGRDPAPR